MYGGSCRWSGGIRVLLVVAVAIAMDMYAHASLAVLVGEPFGNFGTMMPLGHTAIYLDRVCADGPLKVRMCHAGEPQGVVLSRYYAIGKYDWLATPVMQFLYATDRPAEIPTYATSESIWAMREQYREHFLREIVPDGTQGVPDGEGGAKDGHALEEWWETAGMVYNRRFWVYQVVTTAEQDERLVEVMNARSNRHGYHLSGANCADFAAELLNLYYPGSVRHADRIADYGLMTPKHVVRSLSQYAARHEDLELHVWEIDQVPGSVRRSKTVWGGVESALKTKRYLFPLLLIQPEVPLVLEALYLGHGRWKIGDGAQPMPGMPIPQTFDVAATPTAGAVSGGSQ